MKRTVILILALSLCMAFSSCGFISEMKDTLLSPIAPTEESSDFDRYIAHLNSLPDGKDTHAHLGYTVTVCPVQESGETALKYVYDVHVYNSKGKTVSTCTLTFIIPKNGMNANFNFVYDEFSDNGNDKETVEASGVLNTSEYNGTIISFTDFENSRGEYKNDEEIHLEIVTMYMESILKSAKIMLERADLDLTALGFTYTPEEPETNQSVSFQ